MQELRTSNRIQNVLNATTFIALSNMLQAHTSLLAPNGGEILIAGSSTTIQWKVDIEHDTQNFDLWYSTTGATGTMIPIATDLAVGDPSAGSLHGFVWTVPDTPSGQVRVFVRQDNTGVDYFDESDADLTIQSAILIDCNGNGTQDSIDIAQQQSNDFDANGVPDECQALSVDQAAISVSQGGIQSFSLSAGASFGGSGYLLLGTAGATTPGIPLGSLTLALELDAFLIFSLQSLNKPPYQSSFGLLAAGGMASASITIPSASQPALAGLQLHHAYLVLGTSSFAFASNAMPLVLVP